MKPQDTPIWLVREQRSGPVSPILLGCPLNYTAATELSRLVPQSFTQSTV